MSDYTPACLASHAMTWANAETKEQAWPGENHSAQLSTNTPELAAPITQVPHLTTPPTRAELGYIAGTVMVNDVPVAQHQVFCFGDGMTLVAETRSDSDGSYRFDNLLKNRRYMVVANDSFDFYYMPAAADRVYPEGYV